MYHEETLADYKSVLFDRSRSTESYQLPSIGVIVLIEYEYVVLSLWRCINRTFRLKLDSISYICTLLLTYYVHTQVCIYIIDILLFLMFQCHDCITWNIWASFASALAGMTQPLQLSHGLVQVRMIFVVPILSEETCGFEEGIKCSLLVPHCLEDKPRVV